MPPQGQFKVFTDKISAFPLWIKEVMYKELHANLSMFLSDVTRISNTNALFQYEKPQLTYLGKEEIQRRTMFTNMNNYVFLNAIRNKQNILEIALNNTWTLAETAKIYVECLEKQLVSKPTTVQNEALAYYLSGNIRVGEYLKRVGIITIDQLDKAIRTQKEAQENGNKIGMASVCIELGFISQSDINEVLLIKEESSKRFLLTQHFSIK